MDDFNKIYDKLTSIARKQIFDFKLNASPLDLVNDAYIECVNAGLPFTKENAVNFLFKSFRVETLHAKIVKSPLYSKGFKVTEKYCKACGETKPILGFYNKSKNGLDEYISECKECRKKAVMTVYNANKADWLQKAAEYKRLNKEKIRITQQEYYLRYRVLKPEKPRKIQIVVVKEKKIKPVKPPKKVLTPEERRLRQLERSRAYYQKKAKNKEPQPIKILWRKANHRYFEKQKAELTDIYIKSLLKKKYKNPTAEQIEAKRNEIKVNRN